MLAGYLLLLCWLIHDGILPVLGRRRLDASSTFYPIRGSAIGAPAGDGMFASDPNR
jgi:hypothetical protein